MARKTTHTRDLREGGQKYVLDNKMYVLDKKMSVKDYVRIIEDSAPKTVMSYE